MKLKLCEILTALRTLAVALTTGTSVLAEPSPVPPSTVARLSTTPGGFIPNVGQWANPDIRFVLQEGGVTAQFTDRGFVLWTGKSAPVTIDGERGESPVAPRWELVGAQPVPPVGGEVLDHTVSFFKGSDPAAWRPKVPAFGELRYAGILNGVELRVAALTGRGSSASGPERSATGTGSIPNPRGRTGAERGFEYSFHIQPNAKPDLNFRYSGILGLEKSAAGNLVVRTAAGQFTESQPVSFQWIDGEKREVASWFELVSSQEYRIVVGSYDPRHELVVDPVLDWSTSVGGSYGDQINVIKVDPLGEVIVAGVSHSIDLPITAGFAPFGTDPGENYGTDPLLPEHSDVYLAKFSADGTRLIWAGYLGGEGAHPESTGRNKPLAIDDAGDVYITTHTQSPDFPVLPAGSSVFQGGTDASVTKIKADGSAILWSRLMGAEGEDHGYAVAVHGADLYFSGVTTSGSFPVTARSFAGQQDAFIARINALDGTVLWASFLGGSQGERISAMAADASGVLIFGDTDSADFHAPDFPAPSPGHDRILNGGNDAFLTKIDPSGAIQWSRYLGGSGAETTALTPIQGFTLTWGLSDLTQDSLGRIVVAGHTYSSDFPGTAGRFQAALMGSMDGYVAKLSQDGTQVLWATYLGGSGPHDRIVAVGVNPWDEIWVSGGTSSVDFPTTSDALKPTMLADGFQDGFTAKLNADGTQLLYSSYIGNNGWNDAVLAQDYAFGRLLIGGWHFDSFSPITAGTYRQECNNCTYEFFLMSFLDAFMAQDGWESNGLAGGLGDWSGNWISSGDVSILTSAGPHSGSRHVRLRSSTGYLQRSFDVPAASITATLGFWAKVSSFESGDQASVLASSNGGGFLPLATFTSAQSNDQYRYYEVDLGGFLPASQIQIAFDAGMNASNDSWYLDDIRVTGTSGRVPPVAVAGNDQTVADSDNTGAELVTLSATASSDPDGGILVSYAWSEGANPLGVGAVLNASLPVGVHLITLTVTDDEGDVASDTVQVTVQPYVAPVQVFADGFEVSEWNGLWTEDSQNDWYRSNQRATAGSWSAEVDGSADNASMTSIPINLLGRTSATISFDWLIESSLDTGEYIQFRVSTNGGSTWTQKAILRGNQDPENSWRSVVVPLTGISQLTLQFRGKMSSNDEDANIDNVRVIAH
jgi:hypothetical protein